MIAVAVSGRGQPGARRAGSGPSGRSRICTLSFANRCPRPVDSISRGPGSRDRTGLGRIGLVRSDSVRARGARRVGADRRVAARAARGRRRARRGARAARLLGAARAPAPALGADAPARGARDGATLARARAEPRSRSGTGTGCSAPPPSWRVERRMPTHRRAPWAPGAAARRLHRGARDAHASCSCFAAAVAVVAEAVLGALHQHASGRARGFGASESEERLLAHHLLDGGRGARPRRGATLAEALVAQPAVARAASRPLARSHAARASGTYAPRRRAARSAAPDRAGRSAASRRRSRAPSRAGTASGRRSRPRRPPSRAR